MKKFFSRWIDGCGYPPIFCGAKLVTNTQHQRSAQEDHEDAKQENAATDSASVSISFEFAQTRMFANAPQSLCIMLYVQMLTYIISIFYINILIKKSKIP